MTHPLVFDAKSAPWQSLGLDGSVADVKPLVTTAVSDTLGAGFARFERCRFPWKLTYDECVYVIEGRMEVERDGATIAAQPGEVAYLPAGSEVVYSFPGSCLLFYTTYPVNWQDLVEEAGHG